ncbi:NADP-dependent oxidoreductase [Acidothermaceae bacterium B102]|nr:NADP-dependent oxidoreductase [Acidothermaceae bacterium B102]
MRMVKAVVLSTYGPPEVLLPGDIEVGAPGPGQVLIDVRFAGISPTDLAIRAGHLNGAFGSGPGSVLGFEVAGVVNAVGEGVLDVRPGDNVAAFLPELGGYARQTLARYWVRRPDSVSEQDAAALPSAGEAAARVVEETNVTAGETVLIVGAGGAVGLIATQIALGRGASVLAAVRDSDLALVEALGGTPIAYGPDLVASVRKHVAAVDVVIDAAGAGVLAAAVELAGGTERVVTLSDHHAADVGARLSGPDGPQIVSRLQTVMDLVAAGRVRLRSHTTLPLSDAAGAHRGLESRELRTKVVLATQD